MMWELLRARVKQKVVFGNGKHDRLDCRQLARGQLVKITFKTGEARE